MRKFFMKPNVAVALVIAMYLFKATAKLIIGTRINSPMIAGDGWHNLADLSEAVMLLVIIRFAAKKADTEYPFGRKNIESIFQLVIGAVLVWVALDVSVHSLNELLFYAPRAHELVAKVIPLPEHQPLIMREGPLFWWVTGMLFVSGTISFLVGRYEIAVGKRSGARSLVTDGTETLVDSKIEWVALAGVLGQYKFNAPWIEYPLALYVAWQIIGTSRELVSESWQALLQKSIGNEHEAEIRRLTLATHGVCDVAELKTFMTGGQAIIIMKALTRHATATSVDIKHAIAHRVNQYLLAQGFENWDYFIRFDTPPHNRHRRACALVVDDKVTIIAPDLGTATHLRICDMDDGTIVRWKDYEVPAGRDLTEILQFLNSKRVTKLYTFQRLDQGTVVRLIDWNIAPLTTTTYVPTNLGM